MSSIFLPLLLQPRFQLDSDIILCLFIGAKFVELSSDGQYLFRDSAVASFPLQNVSSSAAEKCFGLGRDVIAVLSDSEDDDSVNGRQAASIPAEISKTERNSGLISLAMACGCTARELLNKAIEEQVDKLRQSGSLWNHSMRSIRRRVGSVLGVSLKSHKVLFKEVMIQVMGSNFGSQQSGFYKRNAILNKRNVSNCGTSSQPTPSPLLGSNTDDEMETKAGFRHPIPTSSHFCDTIRDAECSGADDCRLSHFDAGVGQSSRGQSCGGGRGRGPSNFEDDFPSGLLNLECVLTSQRALLSRNESNSSQIHLHSSWKLRAPQKTATPLLQLQQPGLDPHLGWKKKDRTRETLVNTDQENQGCSLEDPIVIDSDDDEH